MITKNSVLGQDEPRLNIPDAQFLGHGLNDDGITYEGFMLKDGTCHFYDVDTGKELDND